MFYQEAETRIVTLEENTCDFARLLQFIYTNAYDQRPGDSTASKAVPLRTFVSEEDLLREGWGTQEARGKLDVDKAVLALARMYGCKSLRAFIATYLVLNLPPSRGFCGGDDAFAEFQADFVKVSLTISEDLEEKPKINELLADELFNFWFKKYDAESKTIPPVLSIGDPVMCTDFQRQLQRFIKDHGSFALEIMRGSLRIASYGFEKLKWSGVRINDLRQYRHHRGAVPGQLNTQGN